MAVPKISDLRTWNGTPFTNDDVDYNSQTIVSWLSDKTSDLDVNTIRAAGGFDASNSKITNVLPATAGTDAVNLDQLNSYSNTNNQYIPFTIANGKVNANGYANYLQKDSDTQLTILAGNTNPDLVIIQSDGTLETLTDNIVLTIPVSNGTYTIVKEKGETPVLSDSAVTTGIVFPVSASDGDYFLLTSGRPYQGYKYASVGGWGEIDFVSMGSATVASGVATLTTLNYNSPNYVNGARTVINTYTSDTIKYRKWSDGFIEQWMTTTGGTITLPLPMTTTKYHIVATNRQTSFMIPYTTSYTTTKFYLAFRSGYNSDESTGITADVYISGY